MGKTHAKPKSHRPDMQVVAILLVDKEGSHALHEGGQKHLNVVESLVGF